MIETPLRDISAIARYFRERGLALALVIGVSVISSLTQGGMSYSVILGPLRDRFDFDAQVLAMLHWLVRAGLLVLAVTLWTLKRKLPLFRVIIVANAFFTAILLYDVGFLLNVLSGSTSRAAVTLLTDVALLAVSNVLIFSIWYWIIDPPGVIKGEDADQPWAFLFPQRAPLCRATNRGYRVTPTTCSSPSLPASRSAQRMRCRSPDSRRC